MAAAALLMNASPLPVAEDDPEHPSLPSVAGRDPAAEDGGRELCTDESTGEPVGGERRG